MNLISINDLTVEQIFDLLNMDHISEEPVRGNAILMFAEPSTRTRVSFEMAAFNRRINTLYLDPAHSSISKGESLMDTFKTLSLYNPDFLVIRHKNGTACQMAESVFGKGTIIINAGTGTTNHPTQALGDAFTIWEAVRAGLAPNIAIVGDVVHSRVARSFIQIADKLEWNVRLFGPTEFLPSHGMDTEHIQYNNLDELGWASFVYVMRPQLERIESDMFNRDDYVSNWRISRDRLHRDQILMHAGPVNRGLEVTSDALESAASLVDVQVASSHLIRYNLYDWLRRN